MDGFVCLQDFENHAIKVMPRGALDYCRSGAGEEITLANNRTAFSDLRIRPKCMKNVSKINTLTTVMGTKISMPVGIAPTAMQKLAHPEGEIATVKAAEKMGTIYILSTISTTSIEDIATTSPNATKWFQLYIHKDRELTANLVKRAEKAGFKALVLTVDSPVFGIRRRDLRNKFSLPEHLTLANFVGNKATGVSNSESGSAIENYVTFLYDSSLVWEDINWLKTLTTLPIIVKGVLTAEDAVRSVEMGATAIIVSNHGGRQLDTVPASIQALPEVVKAVGDKVEVYLDGGVREGVDIFKALSLGAKMVFVGRPVLWGLAYNGEDGVEQVLKTLKNEFENVLKLSGCTSVKEISSDMVIHKTYYSRL